MEKGAKLIFEVTDGTVKGGAYCLSTDSWQDHVHFMREAEALAKTGDARSANRALRASLLFLFAHLEGVVDRLVEAKDLPSEQLPRLCDRTRAIKNATQYPTRLPPINFRLEKAIRDILVHPGIEKVLADESRIDQATIYSELTLPVLKKISADIARWLEAACRDAGIKRMSDTKGLLSDFISELAGKSDPKEV